MTTLIELNPKHSAVFQVSFPEAYAVLKHCDSPYKMTQKDILEKCKMYGEMLYNKGLTSPEILDYWFTLEAQVVPA